MSNYVRPNVLALLVFNHHNNFIPTTTRTSSQQDYELRKRLKVVCIRRWKIYKSELIHDNRICLTKISDAEVCDEI